MRTIIITGEAMQVIQSRATNPFNQTGRRLDGDLYEVPLSDETVARIESCRFAGETMSDAIIRLCSTAGRAAN